jgi:hypothetical protein
MWTGFNSLTDLFAAMAVAFFVGALLGAWLASREESEDR